MTARLYYSLPYEARRRVYSLVRSRKYSEFRSLRFAESEDGYSMRPFDRHRCIFVHVPKAAGISVCRSMFNSLCGAHTAIRHYQVAFSKQEFDSYFKFTFVRNPWSRLYSAYTFLKQGGLTSGDREWAERHLAEYDDFTAFVSGWVTPENIRKYTHFRPQREFLCLPGDDQLQVDFLGLFENIESDYQYVSDRIGLGSSLGRHNTTSGRKCDFRDAYSDETRAIVARVYGEDIRLLGYKFDNSSLPTQLRERSRWTL